MSQVVPSFRSEQSTQNGFVILLCIHGLRLDLLILEDYLVFAQFSEEGRDYEATSYSITIPAGSFSGSLTCSDTIVTVLDDDSVEPSESFGIELVSSDPVLYIGDPNSAPVVIVDDDSKLEL